MGRGDSEALSLTSTFSAAVPDLQLAQARIQANSTATFLEISGQKINELTAETTLADGARYSQSRLDFKGVAKEGQRELAAGGWVVVHPDHHEVHIGDLTLRTEQIEWRTPAGTSAAVQYTKDRIEVENLELVNGDQRITANGVIAGRRFDASRARAKTWMSLSSTPCCSVTDGWLDDSPATRRISGTTRAPIVTSNFTLSQGAFRTFKFEALTGTVDYTRNGVAMDVRLQQTPTTWITAKGIAPLTLFQPTPPGLDPHDEARVGGVVDIQVASSPIGLGLIQGFTPYVTNVTGTLQANVRVTGTGYDPHAEGAIEVHGGAFAIPELGTRYSGLDTRIDLQPDVVTVREFRILDSHGSPLTIGGTLAVHERSVGAVNITFESENFEAIHNRLAELTLDARMKLTGEVRRPRLEGTVDVESGDDSPGGTARTGHVESVFDDGGRRWSGWCR